MHPIQEAVVKNHASQCGFCTPGMVMSMNTKMRETRGVVDIEDVKRCVQGNLCRCTGYRPIIQGFGKLCKEGVAVAGHGNEKGEDANLSSERGGEILRLSNPKQKGSWYQPTRLEDVKELMRTLDQFDIRGGDTGWYEVDRDDADNTINIAEVTALRKVEVLDGAVHVGSALTLTQMERALKNLEASIYWNREIFFYSLNFHNFNLQIMSARTVSSDEGRPLCPFDARQSPDPGRGDRGREHHVGQPRLGPEGGLPRHRV